MPSNYGDNSGRRSQPNAVTDGALTTDFEALLGQLTAEYEVPDIVLPSSSLIFILESPHVQELQFGAPVSGTSGITMTRHLFGDEYAKFALGRLVKKNKDEAKNRPRLNKIGLVNVLNVPMQSAAYRNPTLVQQHKVWFEAMSTVRSDNTRDIYRSPHCQVVQSSLVAQLRQKLAALKTRHCTIVPCGRFAQKFFRLTDVQSDHWTVIDEVPHPSYNSWDRDRYRDVIQAVKDALDR